VLLRPWAAQAELAYGSELWRHKGMLILGWQASGEARALDLPRSRLLAGMRTEVLSHVSLALECRHDEDYSVEDGGGGGSADAVIGRLIFDALAKSRHTGENRCPVLSQLQPAQWPEFSQRTSKNFASGWRHWILHPASRT